MSFRVLEILNISAE